jgi:hypothetical protein
MVKLTMAVPGQFSRKQAVASSIVGSATAHTISPSLVDPSL